MPWTFSAKKAHIKIGNKSCMFSACELCITEMAKSDESRDLMITLETGNYDIISAFLSDAPITS